MAKYVPDILSRRWVIISSQRLNRPHTHGKGKAVCPFCPGHEEHIEPHVWQDADDWHVRVIPNKYPITDFHEVIIHAQDHDKDIETLPLEHVAIILRAYRERYNFYRDKGQVLIFGNHGSQAGASVEHAHSQLVVIPSQINLDTLSREPLNNIVEENTYFNVYCPDFSQWPYEVWIAPKKEQGVYGDLTDEELLDLAVLLQKMLRRLGEIYTSQGISAVPFGYNFYISPKDNWYFRIIPRFVHRAGFELGTGLEVNIVDPSDAAIELRGEDPQVAHVLKKLKGRE